MLVNKTIKFDENQWYEFGRLCDILGYSRSKLLRGWVDRKIEFMQKEIQIKIDKYK